MSPSSPSSPSSPNPANFQAQRGQRRRVYDSTVGKLMVERGKSILDLQMACGVSDRTVRYWMTGEVKPHSRHIASLSQLFKVDPRTFA